NDQQRHNEQEMVNTEKNVLDADFKIETGYSPAALVHWDGRGRLLRCQPAHPGGAVQKCDPHEGVRHRIFEAVDSDNLSAQWIKGPEAPSLYRCVTCGSRRHWRYSLD